jgi:hypothetical protein
MGIDFKVELLPVDATQPELVDIKRSAIILGHNRETGIMALKWALRQYGSSRTGVHFGVYETVNSTEGDDRVVNARAFYRHNVYQRPLPAYDKRLERAEQHAMNIFETYVTNKCAALDLVDLAAAGYEVPLPDFATNQEPPTSEF